MIFHRNFFIKDIQTITKFIDELENSPIINFRNEEKKKYIEDLFKHIPLWQEISKVKDFLLFKKIYENTQGKDQSECFDNEIVKLKELKRKLGQNISDIEIIFKDEKFINVFKDIKEELGKKNESKSDIFIKQMIDYFNINNSIVIKDLKMIL